MPKGGFTQNPVTVYEPAYGQRQSSHMQQEHITDNTGNPVYLKQF